MTKFNFFKILEKDNKELIHSAFISFLLDKNIEFRDFLKIPKSQYLPSKLEKQYSIKNDRCRIDIEMISNDSNNLIFIENKFKSFPYIKQLQKYDKVFKGNFSKEKKLTKILFCFDKSLITFDTDWHIYDYSDLINFISKNYDLTKRDDESIFINHYFLFLKEYYEEYRQILKNSKKLFDKFVSNDDKFWLRLLNSQIVLYFQNKLNLNQFDFLTNPGNTSTPLLNIVPKKWKEITGEELLIQFQGKDLKFYIHSNDKERIQKIINYCSDKLWNEEIEIKKLSKRKEGSCFIFKININDIIDENYSFENLIKVIEDFYHNIDSKMIKNYH